MNFRTVPGTSYTLKTRSTCRACPATSKWIWKCTRCQCARRSWSTTPNITSAKRTAEPNCRRRRRFDVYYLGRRWPVQAGPPQFWDRDFSWSDRPVSLLLICANSNGQSRRFYLQRSLTFINTRRILKNLSGYLILYKDLFG